MELEEMNDVTLWGRVSKQSTCEGVFKYMFREVVVHVKGGVRVPVKGGGTGAPEMQSEDTELIRLCVKPGGQGVRVLSKS